MVFYLEVGLVLQKPGPPLSERWAWFCFFTLRGEPGFEKEKNQAHLRATVFRILHPGQHRKRGMELQIQYNLEAI